MLELRLSALALLRELMVGEFVVPQLLQPSLVLELVHLLHGFSWQLWQVVDGDHWHVQVPQGSGKAMQWFLGAGVIFGPVLQLGVFFAVELLLHVLILDGEEFADSELSGVVRHLVPERHVLHVLDEGVCPSSGVVVIVVLRRVLLFGGVLSVHSLNLASGTSQGLGGCLLVWGSAAQPW